MIAIQRETFDCFSSIVLGFLCYTSITIKIPNNGIYLSREFADSLGVHYSGFLNCGFCGLPITEVLALVNDLPG